MGRKGKTMKEIEKEKQERNKTWEEIIQRQKERRKKG